MKFSRLTLLLINILILSYVLGFNILLLAFLAEIAILIQKVQFIKYRLIFISGYILLLISIFVWLKFYHSDLIYLPLGYSMFSFSVISYLIDNEKEYSSRLDTYCYLFFIPKFFAGPIVKAKDFSNQLYKPYIITRSNVYLCIKILIFASFCKFVLADYLYLVDCDKTIGINALCGIIIYGIAFYFDFYAYSLFAIATAILFGIDLPINFNSPYKSLSFHDFWKRWNITLSTWLKDYIYIPLGGNRKNIARKYLNTIIVFIISALWHGFSIPFIIWGLAHSILLIIERWKNIVPRSIYAIWVFLTSCLLWQLFRVETIHDFVALINRLFSKDMISINSIFLCASSLIIMLGMETKLIKKIVFSTYDNSKPFIFKEVFLLSIMLTLTILLPRSMNFNFFYLRF